MNTIQQAMEIITRSYGESLQRADSSGNLENVLYVVITNGVRDEDRILWTHRKKLYGAVALLFFVLYQFFRSTLFLASSILLLCWHGPYASVFSMTKDLWFWMRGDIHYMC